jgi:hypothetical protein
VGRNRESGAVRRFSSIRSRPSLCRQRHPTANTVFRLALWNGLPMPRAAPPGRLHDGPKQRCQHAADRDDKQCAPGEPPTSLRMHHESLGQGGRAALATLQLVSTDGCGHGRSTACGSIAVSVESKTVQDKTAVRSDPHVACWMALSLTGLAFAQATGRTPPRGSSASGPGEGPTRPGCVASSPLGSVIEPVHSGQYPLTLMIFRDISGPVPVCRTDSE